MLKPMNSILKLLFFTFLISLTLIGCSKSDNTEDQPRKVKYEIIGEVQSLVSIQFTPDVKYPGQDDYDYEDYAIETTLPWNKTVYHHPLTHGGLSFLAHDAIPG